MQQLRLSKRSPRRRQWLGAAVVLAAAMSGQTAQAATCANVRIVVPFPAGGPADQLARTLAHGLQQKRGTPFVVDNKPGANGNIGIDTVRRAPGDGCTLLVAPAGNLTINPTLMPALTYNVERDFRAVSLLAGSPNVLAVHPSVKANSVQELVKLAQQADKSGKPLGYASPGVGSGLHLAGELFRHKAGIALLHVPYKGTTQALNDVVGGQVPMLFGTWPTLAPFIQSGQLRALAVTQARRSPAAPGVPSLAEQGVGGIDVSSWYALLAPRATPQQAADALSADVRALLATPAVRAELQRQGMEPAGSTPQALEARIRQETASWAKLIREYGITAE
ncbi:tripartite tricarboxylate transporter substrate binding protein [Cupriavidus consociatus]|uniref:tripartite tricarboxylate transporter substrate binding protein n=1 Tax=Cupriavidus consociatus TaxID=2821357 RepID=UPI001AE76412|nr:MULTISPECIES: tripartite tricarboxylate transporter substrate binding protein [unclassified Cupriavidus]MBP0621647.1 tripartite tricarboxylate transporter substrate binding protein [Cupriavidus sp. LEh25]MDK2658322.1 tripartite tricarboxylate transporter substrate binding protein [Cupriavidus sp. LEh21]